ncbi:hypothetical protein ABZ733_34705 [Streptomyces longwoodensis]
MKRTHGSGRLIGLAEAEPDPARREFREFLESFPLACGLVEAQED